MTEKEKLLYTKEHEWVEQLEAGKVRIGISEFAARQLGDIVYVEYLTEGDAVKAGDELVTVESVKSVSEVFAPVSGTLISRNKSLADSPETVNQAPFTDGWMVELQLTDESELDKLLSYDEYEAFIAEEE